MISVDNKVKNIYYMLCYSFNKDLLKEREESIVDEETFNNIYTLFSTILCKMLKKQIKKGINKDYTYCIDEINSIKGKINITESIKRNSFNRKKVICEFDEFSENTLLNQIIKTTCFYLIKSNKISTTIKYLLKKYVIYFSNVDLIDIHMINWNILRFNKFNCSYKNILLICRFILQGLIVTDKKGNYRFQEFIDDTQVSIIYENFIREFYRKHYPEFKAMSKKLYFTKTNDSFIPIMRTDIVLKNNRKTLIIDAKFYSKIILDGYHGSKVLSSSNLYQIYAYVDSQDPYKTDSVYGMLLYAQTLNDPKINTEEQIVEHTIVIRTIDLNDEWMGIKNTLDDIAKWFKEKSKV